MQAKLQQGEERVYTPLPPQPEREIPTRYESEEMIYSDR